VKSWQAVSNDEVGKHMDSKTISQAFQTTFLPTKEEILSVTAFYSHTFITVHIIRSTNVSM
jgi:hypothetical protein